MPEGQAMMVERPGSAASPARDLPQAKTKQHPPMTQMTLPQALETALQLFRTGQLQPADDLCRDILNQLPEQPSALHLQALVARQRGRQLKALALIDRAIAITPEQADMQCHYG